MTDIYEVNIPFNGFYESAADALLEAELESMLADEDGEPFYALIDRARGNCNWREVRKEYARMYTEVLGEEIELPLHFKALGSPSFYNSETDTITATLTLEAIKQVRRNTNTEELIKVCAERHTSRSGFHSFYNPDYTTWGPVETWDHNQLGSLLRAYIETGGFDCDEYFLLDGSRGNGRLSSLIERHTPSITSIYNAAETLRAVAA